MTIPNLNTMMDKFNRVDIKQPFAFEVTVYSDYTMSNVLLDPSMVEEFSYPSYNIENIKTDYYSFQHILPAYNPNIELSITYLENENLYIHSVVESFFYPNNGTFYEVPTVFIVAKIYDIHSNSILNVNFYEGVLSDYSMNEYRYETPELYKITLKFMCKQKIRSISNGTGSIGQYGDGMLQDRNLKFGTAMETFFSEAQKLLKNKALIGKVKGKKYTIETGDIERLKQIYEKLQQNGFTKLGPWDTWQDRYNKNVAEGKLNINSLSNLEASVNNLIKVKSELEKTGYTLDLSSGYGSIFGNHTAPNSIHYDGRAFDVKYYKYENGKAVGDSIGARNNAEETQKIIKNVGEITQREFGFGLDNKRDDGGAIMGEAENGNGWTHISFQLKNGDTDEWVSRDAGKVFFDVKKNGYSNY